MSDAEIAAKLRAVLEAECDADDLASRLCIIAALVSNLLHQFQETQGIDGLHGLLSFVGLLHDRISWIRQDRHLHEPGHA